MEILLLRHGQTFGNARGCYIGRTNDPLCPAGQKALVPYADPLAGFVYVTPLCRTAETAQLIFPHLPQKVLPPLREMSFGIFEGKNFEELKSVPAYTAWVEGGCEAAPPGGETLADFTARCADCFENEVQKGLISGAPQLIFVVHGGTIMALLSRFSRPKRNFFDQIPQNGCGYRLTLDPTEWASDRVFHISGELCCRKDGV